MKHDYVIPWRTEDANSVFRQCEPVEITFCVLVKVFCYESYLQQKYFMTVNEIIAIDYFSAITC